MIRRGSLVIIKKISYDKEPELYGPVSQGYMDCHIGEEVIVTNRKCSNGNVEVLTNVESMCNTKYFLKEDIEDTGKFKDISWFKN